MEVVIFLGVIFFGVVLPGMVFSLMGRVRVLEERLKKVEEQERGIAIGG